MSVYKSINKVQDELSKIGISKDRRNTQGSGYNFRGIDDIYNALAPALSRHGLCILPRVINREVVERTSKSGGALFYTTLDVEFDFVAAEDGSKHTVRVMGEAMDSGDKSTNKAMSAAYKYACLQTFCIPTEGDNDADSSTHEVKSSIDVNSLVETIYNTTTMDELKKVYFAAIEASKGMTQVQKSLEEAKDKQKILLSEKQ